MKKRVLSVVCALALSVMATCTAFAQPSVSAKPEVASAVTADGTDVSTYIVVDAVKADEQAVVDEKMEDVDAIAAFDVDKKGDVKFPVTLTFEVAGVTSGSTVLHFENGEWKDITVEAETGKISAKFDSFSPVIITAGNPSASTENPSADTTKPETDGNQSSPAGDAAAMMTVVVLAGAAAVVSFRKKAF